MWAFKYANTSRRRYVYLGNWIWVCRIAQGIVLGNARLTTFLHICVSLVDVFCYSAVDPLLHKPVGVVRDGTHMFAYQQGFTVIIASGLVWMLEHSMYREAYAITQVAFFKQAESITSGLLGGMCDAVVRFVCISVP